jgi:hypothetical protein
MLVVQDKNSGDIITQVFNIADYFPGKQSITAESKNAIWPSIINFKLVYRCGKALESKGCS